MRQAHANKVSSTSPALIVTYGNTPQKVRPLDRPLFLIGRSQTCDLTVASPEVAPVHCLIAHIPQGWLLRNCSGHVSTRLNGSTVTEQLLCDEDVLQVGIFTFRVRLPGHTAESYVDPVAEMTPPEPSLASSRDTQRPDQRQTAPLDDVEGRPSRPSRPTIDLTHLEHLRRSRRNLCRLALLMRDRLASAQQELKALREEIREQREDLEIREEELRELEEELNTRQDALTRDESYLETRATRLEKEATLRQKEVEARIDTLWREHQERCQREEEQHRQRLEALQPTLACPDTALQEEARRLAIRARELGHFARYLSRRQEARTLPATPAQVDLRTEADTDLARELEDAQESLQVQEREIERLRAALEHFAQHPPAMAEHCQPDTQDLEEQCQQLRDLLAEANDRIALLEAGQQQPGQGSEDLIRMLEIQGDDLEAQLHVRQMEIQDLLRRSQEREEEMSQRLSLLSEQAHEISQRLREREAEVEKLRMERDDQLMQVNLEHSGGYERELHRFRLELERDRRLLSEQIAQVTAREEEVEEAARRAELEMSRDRALLARERAELMRLRDEIRIERDKLQRDGGLRGRLAGVNALKDQLPRGHGTQS